jgi:hypothetical protein
LKRHLQKHSQNLETKTTEQANNESEGSQSCTDDDIGEDDTVAVILDTETTAPLPTTQTIVKEIHKTAVLSALDTLKIKRKSS